MKGRMKKISALTIAASMALSLVACGNQSTEGAEKGNEKTKIKITWWGGQGRHDSTQKVLDLYTQSHPDVEFEAIPSGWDGYFDKLSTQAASGSMPDIVQMDYLYISTYAKNNSIADLQEYIDNGTIDTKNIDDKILNTGKIDDKMAGIVLSSSLISVGYNPDVLAGAGVKEPTSDWTWNDFVEASVKVSNATGKPSAMASAGVASDTNIFNYWVRQHGKTLFNEKGTALGYEDDSIAADFFQMWKDMMDKNASPDPDEMAQIVSLGQEAGPIVTGDGAFNFDWNNYTSRMSKVNDKLKIATPPLANDSQDMGLWIKPGMFFSIAETSKVKDECAEFINWFINSEEANDIIMAERGTPVSSEIRNYMVDSGKMNQQQVEMFQYVDKATELCGNTPAPDPAGISEINKAFDMAANSVFYGQATAEDAAKTFREEANAILERNNK
ncbi:MAG: sugar ABC transporter substrate-binding protein [Clostridium sp.]|uniref:ABC transporter substrate-binding protein n=1 Tax=Clostridium sp. TaxID=1506 RepID=UPI00290864C9|nr:sugar ABC transporter substrate-binding protein [Clostridium sp.]MDU5109909.1 sugar ABC transporter substrate-binding protein [Clostridium sp.]